MYSQEFEVGGKTRRLKYDFNAIADVEEASGMGVAKLFSEDMIGLHTLRLLVWAGLKHEERGITIQRAGMIIKDMMAEGHDLEAIMMLIMGALTKSGIFPADVSEQKDENPTKAEKSAPLPKQSKS
jgi:hypothetical protein